MYGLTRVTIKLSLTFTNFPNTVSGQSVPGGYRVTTWFFTTSAKVYIEYNAQIQGTDLICALNWDLRAIFSLHTICMEATRPRHSFYLQIKDAVKVLGTESKQTPNSIARGLSTQKPGTIHPGLWIVILPLNCKGADKVLGTDCEQTIDSTA